MAVPRWQQAMVVVLAAAGVGALAGSQQAPPAAPPAVVEGLAGNWRLGDYETDTIATIDAAGGEVTVAGGDLDGLRLEVPAGAVVDGTEVTIEHAAIRSQTWGNAIDPTTPARCAVL